MGTLKKLKNERKKVENAFFLFMLDRQSNKSFSLSTSFLKKVALNRYHNSFKININLHIMGLIFGNQE